MLSIINKLACLQIHHLQTWGFLQSRPYSHWRSVDDTETKMSLHLFKQDMMKGTAAEPRTTAQSAPKILPTKPVARARGESSRVEIAASHNLTLNQRVTGSGTERAADPGVHISRSALGYVLLPWCIDTFLIAKCCVYRTSHAMLELHCHQSAIDSQLWISS